MSDFSKGDKVHWTHEVWRGHSLSMTTRRGVVVSKDERTGCCVVKFRSKLINMHSMRLRRDGERSELTDIVMDAK